MDLHYVHVFVEESWTLYVRERRPRPEDTLTHNCQDSYKQQNNTHRTEVWMVFDMLFFCMVVAVLSWCLGAHKGVPLRQFQFQMDWRGQQVQKPVSAREPVL